MEKKIQILIAKYTLYVSNLQYHLDTNLKDVPTKKASKERLSIQGRIRDFEEVVSDLNLL